MRKVLSFVLVLSLVLGSFSMAFAADSSAGLTDIAGNANADAIQVAYDLGIVTGNPDGTFQPDKAVNRAEFAAMITRALAIPKSALAGYTSTTFKDTVGYGWAVPYLAFCQSKGIMLGDGAGNAMPGRTITVNEAVTMALRAIGYTQNSALLVGAWPANYVSIAQNEDLYDKVGSATTVDKASAAQIIYNLLTVQKVAVNSDGETIFQEDKNGDALNLLNSNLGAEEVEEVTLGYNYSYDKALINITAKIGAYGTAYVNDDDELIAFDVKSDVLTGKINDDDEFEADDTEYTLPTPTNTAILFVNANDSTTTQAIDADAIEAFAAANTDDGETVTIYADVSGKKIKEIYSIVAWDAIKVDLADADVQEDIADDKELLDKKFVLDDDDEIDKKSFQLLGVASLDDIAEDNVVYVYADGNDIRKVAVGTETVEGVVEETDGSDTITIDGVDYDISPLATAEATGVDADSEGTFYLDYYGEVYDFDGTEEDPDTFAIIKAAYDSGNSYDDARIKLYLSDDSTKTLNFAEEDLADLDLVTESAIASVGDVEAALGVTGAVIGYSLNDDGDIDALDVTGVEGSIEVKSSKVLRFNDTADYTIDSDAVVFTFDADDGIDGGDYDVSSLSELKKVTTDGAILLDDKDKVVAILLPDTAVDAEEDDVYGVFNDRYNATTDGDEVYRFTGYIDGAEFSKKTDDRSGFPTVAGVFGLYKVTVDVNDVITEIAAMGNYVEESESGVVAQGEITKVERDGTILTIGGKKYTVEEDAIVYKFDEDDEAYSVADLDDLDEEDVAILYDTQGDDADGSVTVIVFK